MGQSDIPDDDSYMWRTASDLLQTFKDRDSSDIMPALMAANHILNWHIGRDTNDGDEAEFARRFPSWSTINKVVSGRQPILHGTRIPDHMSDSFPEDEPFADHQGRVVPLSELCSDFLNAYEETFLSSEVAAAKAPNAPYVDR